jgi:predicted transcriptional regulator
MTVIELNGNRPKRRDKLIIMTEIIDISIKGTSKTQIMYKANLSFSQLKRYLTLLSRHDLLKKSAYDGREIYKATPKGIDFMKKQQQIIDLINEGPYRNGVKPYPFNHNARREALPIQP